MAPDDTDEQELLARLMIAPLERREGAAVVDARILDRIKRSRGTLFIAAGRVGLGAGHVVGRVALGLFVGGRIVVSVRVRDHDIGRLVAALEVAQRLLPGTEQRGRRSLSWEGA